MTDEKMLAGEELRDSAGALQQILAAVDSGSELPVRAVVQVSRVHGERANTRHQEGRDFHFDFGIAFLLSALAVDTDPAVKSWLPTQWEAMAQTLPGVRESSGRFLNPKLRLLWPHIVAGASDVIRCQIGQMTMGLILASSDSPDLSRAADSGRSQFLYAEYRITDNPDLLGLATAAMESAISSQPLGPGGEGPIAHEVDFLGTLWYMHFELTNNTENLVNALKFHQQALEIGGTGRVGILDNIGATQWSLGVSLHDGRYLNDAITSYSAALRNGGLDREIVRKLWRVITSAVEEAGLGPILDRAVMIGGELLTLESGLSGEYSQRAAGLGEMFRVRFFLKADDGNRDDLDGWVNQMQGALESATSDDDRARLSVNVATAFATRYDFFGEIEDGREAVRLWEQGLDGLALGNAQRLLFKRDLDSVRVRTEEPEQKTALDGKSSMERELEWVHRLHALYQDRPYPAFLGREVELAARAASRYPDSPKAQMQYAAALRMRYQFAGDPADLVSGESALRTIDLDVDTPHIGVMFELGIVLKLRYECGHGIECLHESVRIQQLGSALATGQERMALLNGLGHSLIRRYERSGFSHDLELSIKTLNEALLEGKGSPISQGHLLNNLGSAFGLRYAITHDREDLYASIGHHRQAVENTYFEHVQMPVRLSNLAMCLKTAFVDIGDEDFLDEAVTVSRRALDSTQKDSPERARRLANLAGLLATRYRNQNNLADLNAAIEYGAASTRSVQPGSVREAEILISHGDALAQRLRAHGRDEDRKSAIQIFERAAALDTSLVSDRAIAARNVATLVAATDLEGAVDHASTAFDMLGAFDWHGLPLSDQAALVRDWTGFAVQAAEWALSIDLPWRAVELLEHGRGTVWSQVVSRDADIDPLIGVRSDLAQQWTALIESTPAIDAGSVLTGGQLSDINTRRKRLLAEIREVRGMEGFLSAPSVKEVANVVRNGPAVYVNLTDSACTAIIVRPGMDVELLMLDGCKPETARARINEFQIALSRALYARAELLNARRRGQPLRKATRIAFHAAIDTVRSGLEWGWEMITEPIIARALADQTRSGRDGLALGRIWWCPTGPLTQFPLHATGIHGIAGDSVLDRVISSETPTLRMLVHSYQVSPEKVRPSRTLTVGVSNPFGREDYLEQVAAEISGVIAGSKRSEVTVLDGLAATREQVLSQLPVHSHFHFAGHGSPRFESPSNTALQAVDGAITVADLVELHLGGHDLAFLSVCHGSDPGPVHSDEALHLAGAAQAVGFKHVIAARDSIEDDIAVRVSNAFYRELGIRSDPAVALHRALHGLRDELRAEAAEDELVNPFAWIHHTHSGPAYRASPSDR
ncbi:CHAT domain-containing protein [Nocardia sp. NPDC059195]|uniref:CHAT domain-containing protein n=1 Tax=Nocardia sp. NPDC059195 TaxID=3346765 RepID=UPI0036B96BCC